MIVLINHRLNGGCQDQNIGRSERKYLEYKWLNFGVEKAGDKSYDPLMLPKKDDPGMVS